MAQVSAQIGVGDFYTLKSDPSLRGFVNRTWHDTDTYPFATSNRFLVHKDLPDHLRQQIKRTKLLPRNYVVLKILTPKVELLIHTDDLILIDKYFARGDVVKKSPSDAQSGTVIGTTCSCNIRPFLASELGIDTDAHVTNVDAQKLMPFHPWGIGDTVFFQDWVGTITDIEHAVVVRLEDRSVVEIQDAAKDVAEYLPPLPLNFAYVRLDSTPAKKKNWVALALPCYPLQKVRIKKRALLKSRWICGTYNAATRRNNGMVLGVRYTGIEVRWRMPSSDKPGGVVSIKPHLWLHRALLESGKVRKYEFSNSANRVNGVQDPFAVVVNMLPGEYVMLKDRHIIKSLNTCSAENAEQQSEHSVPQLTPKLDGSSTHETSTEQILASLHLEWYTAEIISTASRVKVQWQDKSITDEPSSVISPYNEVDDYDVWPGEIVSLKGPEAVQQDTDYERMVRTRAAGVVQSVNATERIAKVRWFSGVDITITGEDYDILVRPHSKLGKITKDMTEASLYELGSYQALTRRRGDLVRLERPKDVAGRNGIDWFGEVVDLLPNGQILIRLGALDNVRDIRCSVLNVTVVVSADDDTTESESFDDESSEEWEDGTMMAEEEPISTSIEYEGETPSDSAVDDEEDWETDSDDHAASRDEASVDKSGRQDLAPTAKLTPEPPDVNTEFPMDIDSSNAFGLEETDPQNEPLATNNLSSPAAFEILEGSAPKQASAVGSGNHTIEWLRAVSREHKILRTSLPEGVYVRTWESDMELLRVLIVGPSGTPYAYAPFLFDITLHNHFPSEAPTAYFHSWTNGVGRVNPNLYENGKVCLSLLGTWTGDDDDEEWVPGKSTILQIIVSLLGLVLVKEPFYNEAGFEALQGTAQSKPTSAVYSEKAFVLSRGFVLKALQSLPDGCADIIERLYLPSRNGLSLLRTVVQDCQRFLQQEPPPTIEQAAEHQLLNLERYHIDSPKLSMGILILLRKMLPDLEDLLRYEERLVAEAQAHVEGMSQAMEVDGGNDREGA
ncbi:MAG: hypothetical protein Q9209_000017 [Squamulea sp. 1 TL-2023]